MTTSLEHVRYSCGIAGEEVAEMVDQLEAENARLTHLVELHNKTATPAEFTLQENARLKEELAAAQAESKRYRWLRDNECADVRIQHVGKRSWAALDFAIDEAIAKENGK